MAERKKLFRDYQIELKTMREAWQNVEIFVYMILYNSAFNSYEISLFLSLLISLLIKHFNFTNYGLFIVILSARIY